MQLYASQIQEKHHFLYAQAHLRWTEAEWNTVLWSDESEFGFIGVMDAACSVLKRTGTIQFVIAVVIRGPKCDELLKTYIKKE